ncbi:aspartate aminotransferase family protein [Breoghania sp.]|uniref:aspartate aminotransferase family protein n=1 Tax=Breoghania sp. TaxID=2065378 RepID=UPI002AA8F91B|nr:aspartate aminotransferase family protein [Breoghania sp.]
MSSSSLFGTYARSNLAFVKGEGSWLETADGRRFLDFAAGIAVNSLGHCHPHLTSVLQEQAAKLWHVSNIYAAPGQERLAERLCAATFADRVFFTNSGAEAMEACIKTARRYQYTKGSPERFGVITFEGAFHGRTIATIAAGGQAKYLEGFGPKAAGFDQVPFGDLDAVKAAINDTTAAILIEPIQGEGGIRPVPHEFLRGLRALCDAHGLLLIYDEVQTGVGRTGKFFAHEWSGVAPDIMGVAKGIGGGFPMGACLATEEAAAGMVPGTHGTTYGGNMLAMAVGNAVLDIVLGDGFIEDVARKGILLKQKLASVVDSNPDVFDMVRGEGLMLGIKCKAPVGEVVASGRNHGILTVPAGDNVMRLLPPLTATEEEIDMAVERLDAAAMSVKDAMMKGASA